MYKSHPIFIKILRCWVLVLGNNTVNAAVVYTYTGNNYIDINPETRLGIYDSSMNLSISFTTDNLITNFNGDITALVSGFSSFDGVNLTTEGNADYYYFAIHTDSAGNVLEWDINVYLDVNFDEVGDRSFGVRSQYIIGRDGFDFVHTDECLIYTLGNCYSTEDYYGRVFNNPGDWTVVPIPPALWLFGSGLLGLVGISRCKKST